MQHFHDICEFFYPQISEVWWSYSILFSPGFSHFSIIINHKRFQFIKGMFIYYEVGGEEQVVQQDT